MGQTGVGTGTSITPALTGESVRLPSPRSKVWEGGHVASSMRGEVSHAKDQARYLKIQAMTGEPVEESMGVYQS